MAYDMTHILYTRPLAERPVSDRTIIWAHIRTLVRDLAGDTTRERHDDAIAAAATLRFADMPADVLALFRVVLEQMPAAQDHLTTEQLDIVMTAPAIEKPLALRTSVHGLDARYHEMGIQV